MPEDIGPWGVRLLGPVTLVRGDDVTPSTSALLRTLLALLALDPASPVATSTIIDELWGEALPRDPRAALHAQVTRLRRWLAQVGAGPDALLFTNGGYELAPPPLGVDLAHVLEVVSSLPGGQVVAAADLLRRCDEARRRWAGEPFGGCVLGARLEGERLRIEELKLRVAERRSAALLELGRHDEAIAELRSLLAANPARERVVEMTMLALYQAGRQHEALELFQRTRAHLVDQLGLSPGPRLADLEIRILQHDPELPRAPASAPKWESLAADRSQPRPRIFGRDPELELLVGAGTDARGEVVVVTGEAGSGKTTLLQAAIHDSAAAGSVVGTASFEGDPSPLAGWHEAVRSLGVEPLTVVDQDQPGLIGRVRATLGALACTRPVVLALEDVTRADSASLGLLLGLVKHGLPPGVRIIVSVREPDVDAGAAWAGTFADLARLPVVRQVRLGELPLDAVRSMTISRLRHLGERRAEELALLLHRRTGGHPLHLAALLDVMAALPDEAACREAAGRVPATLLPLVAYQLASLPTGCREVVEALAVAGAGTPPQLGAILGVDGLTVVRRLRPALDLGVVVDLEGTFRLRHALIREAVTDTTPPSARQQIHLALLDEAERNASDAFIALRHAIGAGPLVARGRLGAARWRAGRTAYARGAFIEAVGLLEEASADVPEDQALEVRLHLALALEATGATDRADRLLDDVVEHAGPRIDLATAAAVADEALGLRVNGDLHRLDRLQRVFASLPRGAGRERLEVSCALVLEETLVHGKVRTGDAEQTLAGSVELLHGHRDRARLAQLEARSLVDAPVSALDRLSVAEQAHDLARLTSDPVLQLNALELLVTAVLAAGQLERCRDLLWELGRAAETIGRPRSVWVAQLLDAALLQAAGDPAADVHAHEAMTTGSRLGIPDAAGAFGVHLLVRHCLAEEVGTIAPLILDAVSTYPRISAWRAAAALALAHAGDEAAAREQLGTFLDLRRASANRYFDRAGLCLGAQAALHVGDAAAAATVLDALPPDEAVIVVGAGAAVLGPVDLYVAMAEHVVGAAGSARSHLEAATDLAGSLGWRPWVAACERLRRRHLDATGPPERSAPADLPAPSTVSPD